MPTYAVTGATGQLGRLVVRQLLERGVPAADVAALVRTPERAADLAALGVDVRLADYDRPQTLAPALEGVRRLLLVSGSEMGKRVPQHRAVVEAAQGAGLELLAYTSILRADTTTLALAPEHRATEELLAASDVPYALLRNGWYAENYESQLPAWVTTGELLTASGDARLSLAARADYAAAAVAVLVDGRAGDVLELGGPAVTFDEVAAAVSEATGSKVAHRSVGDEEYVTVLRSAGVDEGTVAFLAPLEAAQRAGDLETASDDLERLIGRPVTPLVEVFRRLWSSRD